MWCRLLCVWCLSSMTMVWAQTERPFNVNAPNPNPFDINQSNNSPDIRRFITRMTAEQGIDGAVLQTLLNKAKWSQKSLELTRPKTSINTENRRRDWIAYRARFLTPSRLNLSLNFWWLHGATLRRAEQEFGVPASIISSILNIESRYGEQTGRYYALDALATLAFYHPTRRDFFQQELATLIRMWRAGQVDIFQMRSSYAGALGIGQFMPSSLAAYALDYNGDGVIHPEDPEDAIGSVANFIKLHGWQPTSSIASFLQPFNIDAWESSLPINDWLEKGPKPTLNRESLMSAIKILTSTPSNAPLANSIIQSFSNINFPVALIDLPHPRGTQYRLGSWNYYVITRYNRSFDYATAVVDLAKAIECALVEDASTDRSESGIYSCLGSF